MPAARSIARRVLERAARRGLLALALQACSSAAPAKPDAPLDARARGGYDVPLERRPQLGERCDPERGEWCAPDFECERPGAKVPTGPGSCVVRRARAGQACAGPNRVPCAEGECVVSSGGRGANGRCVVAPSPEGAMCAGLRGALCAPGSFCDMTGARGRDAAGTCRRPRADEALPGERCGPDTGKSCLPGLDCDSPDGRSGAPVCVEIPRLGQACAAATHPCAAGTVCLWSDASNARVCQSANGPAAP